MITPFVVTFILVVIATTAEARPRLPDCPINGRAMVILKQINSTGVKRPKRSVSVYHTLRFMNADEHQTILLRPPT